MKVFTFSDGEVTPGILTDTGWIRAGVTCGSDLIHFDRSNPPVVVSGLITECGISTGRVKRGGESLSYKVSSVLPGEKNKALVKISTMGNKGKKGRNAGSVEVNGHRVDWYAHGRESAVGLEGNFYLLGVPVGCVIKVTMSGSGEEFALTFNGETVIAEPWAEYEKRTRQESLPETITPPLEGAVRDGVGKLLNWQLPPSDPVSQSGAPAM